MPVRDQPSEGYGGSGGLGRLVLDTDALLCSPDYPRLAEWLRTAVPTDQLDQLDAAVDQVRAGTDAAVAAGVAAGSLLLSPGEHPDWARLGALAALVTWLGGRGSTCVHSPHPIRPQPIVAAAWRPDLMVCAACTHLLRLPCNNPADRTCDACGRVCTGVDAGDPIWPASFVIGPLQYLLGACIDCRYWPA